MLHKTTGGKMIMWMGSVAAAMLALAMLAWRG